MRLSNVMRDAFIRTAMAEVPRVDYEEAISKAARADAALQLPPKVLALYNNKELSHFIAQSRQRVGGQYVYVPSGGDYRPTPAANLEVERLSAAREKQSELHNTLRCKLRACAYSCSTRKALAALMPEFEKYLPADEVAASRSVPVVLNVVSDFVKAGWPKTKKAPK